MDYLPKEISTSLQKGKNINKEWNNENKLNLLIDNCINIENKTLDINKIREDMKRCDDEKNSKIKFFAGDSCEMDDFINNIKTLGKVYKNNNEKTKYISHKDYEEKDINIFIKTIDIEPKGISIDFFGLNDEKYNYYINGKNFKENDIILIMKLEGKEKNFLEPVLQILNSSLIKPFTNSISILNETNELLINFNFVFINEILNNIKNININKFLDISLSFKNNLSIDRLFKMNYKEIFINFLSFIISIKGKSKNIQDSFLLYEDILTIIEKCQEIINNKKLKDVKLNDDDELKEKDNGDEKIGIEPLKEKDNEEKIIKNENSDLKLLDINNKLEVIEPEINEEINTNPEKEEKSKEEEDEEKDIEKEEEIEQTGLHLLYIFKNLNIKLSLFSDMIFFYLTNSEKKDIYDFIKNIKKKKFKEFKEFLRYFNEFIFKDIFKFIRLDHFIFSLIIIKYNSGFVLDTTIPGLTNISDELMK